ncbi:hypothetical protein EW026_g7241 [Hermanssonia centrifuga]|uniref:Uncharacterized protein n=1 Tax=Hermanssonia centrifuga TaxID=98765 RepID=A0A4S4KCY4_9APHY|nr:hypothetical protein EW026_g7241 [Hermanssonia centrifuga]
MISGLNEEQTKAVLEFAELKVVEMLISIKVSMMKYQNELNERLLRFYVRHPDYQSRLRNHVAAALLSVDVRAYVTGMLVQMLEHFQKNLDALCLPSNVNDDPVNYALFKSSVSDELAGQRSTMKGKITAKLDVSIKQGQDIYLLTKNLLVYDIKPRPLHFAKFAFLRAAAMDFNKLLPEQRKSSGSFWEFIDSKLVQVRESIREFPKGPERDLREAEFFATVLKNDKQLHNKVKAGALTQQTIKDSDGHEWQRTMEATVGRFVVEDDELVE